VIGIAILAATLSAAPEVSANPQRVLLGSTPEVAIEVRASNPAALRARASTGTLSPKELVGTEGARYTWKPPGARFPHFALLVFWVERGSNPPDLAVLRIPLVGRTDLEVNTEPRADVRVEVGDHTFGPRRADGRGHAVIPVEVPPGIAQAKVLSDVGGASKTVQVALDPPPFNHLAAVVGPDPLPRSGGWAWLVAAEKVDAADVKREASGGEVTPWPAPPTTYPDRVLFQVRPTGESLSVSATLRAGGPDDVATFSIDAEEPSIARPRALERPLLQPGIFVGGTYAGGANLSLAASVALDVSFPPLGTAFATGLALEGYTMGLHRTVSLGNVDSWILALSPLAVVRYQLFELGAVAFHLRGGAGPLFFVHQFHTDFSSSWLQTGVSAQAFAGMEVTYRVGPLDMLMEVRASMGQVRTAQVDANIGGLVFGLGGRVIK